ncbi:hypothetical protein [Corynebacterium sp. CCM 9204]|uniref:hypothetical protein n=1 Tax=Corynebacterium sp. CCM 9204 TaxID=3057616 RepID=UPI00352546B8
MAPSQSPRRRVVRRSTALNIDRSVDRAAVTRRITGIPEHGRSDVSADGGFDEAYWRSQRPPHWG